MPVIIVGADTNIGRPIVDALLTRDGEVRAFVSDEGVGEQLKARKVKVALGDVSDASHVSAAATRCFTAVLIQDAATDHRERAFSEHPDSTLQGWLTAVEEAQVRRLIWVGAEPPVSVPVAEYASVDPTDADPTAVAAEVAALDEVAAL